MYMSDEMARSVRLSHVIFLAGPMAHYDRESIGTCISDSRMIVKEEYI